LTLSSELAQTLRRFRAAKRQIRLDRRPLEALPFAGRDSPPRPLLLDSTVYIDQLQAKFPAQLNHFLRLCVVRHSAVALAEIVVPFGRLDPAHPRTPAAVRQIEDALAQVPARRIATPDLSVWCEAAIASGLVGRLRGQPDTTGRRLLNDALIFFDARKHGRTVLTRNITDFDLLQQLAPDGQVLFYRI
jgi:predicted nucleic acid-binding protein